MANTSTHHSSPVERYFHLRAAEFDRIYQHTPFVERTLNQWLRRAIYARTAITVAEVRRLGAPSVLDVGSGSGANSLAFMEAGASEVLGIDFASAMIELARTRAGRANLARPCMFEQIDFSNWETDKRFDVVAALGVFDYVADARVFYERMLKHANRSVVASFPKYGVRGWLRKVRYELRRCPLYMFGEDEVHDWARGAGWQDFEIPYRDSGGFVAVARK